MKVVRINVFESNSSATSSLCIASEGMQESYLHTDDEGYILTDFGDFEYGAGEFWTQYDKLSFLVTCCYYFNGWDEDVTAENCYQFKNIEEAVCEYTGAPGIRILHRSVSWGFDHQIQPEYGEFPLDYVDVWDKESIQSFIFNSLIGLKIGHD